MSITITKNKNIQILRAVAIIAVVLIHTAPLGLGQVFIRPFINFAVALFLFLSGYLTNVENSNWLSFYKKRISRILVPYLIWSVLYSLANKQFDIFTIFENILTAKACGILYYVFVYIQFVLLTPLLGIFAKSKYRSLGWFIAPLTILAYQYYSISTENVNSTISLVYGLSCLEWFTFYYLGLVLGNKICACKYSVKQLSVAYILSILIQMLEGYGWFLWGDVNCGTQCKVSVILTNTIFLLLVYHFIKSAPKPYKVLSIIGDYSFGIYLAHIAVISVLHFVLPFYDSIPFIINTLLVFFTTLMAAVIAHRILGDKVSRWLGLI